MPERPNFNPDLDEPTEHGQRATWVRDARTERDTQEKLRKEGWVEFEGSHVGGPLEKELTQRYVPRPYEPELTLGHMVANPEALEQKVEQAVRPTPGGMRPMSRAFWVSPSGLSLIVAALAAITMLGADVLAWKTAQGRAIAQRSAAFQTYLAGVKALRQREYAIAYEYFRTALADQPDNQNYQQYVKAIEAILPESGR